MSQYIKLSFTFDQRDTWKFKKSKLKKKSSQLLLYYKFLFLLLFHNPEGTLAGHSVVPHIPEGTGRAHLGTGLHLDIQIHLHPQSSADTVVPRKMH